MYECGWNWKMGLGMKMDAVITGFMCLIGASPARFLSGKGITLIWGFWSDKDMVLILKLLFANNQLFLVVGNPLANAN